VVRTDAMQVWSVGSIPKQYHNGIHKGKHKNMHTSQALINNATETINTSMVQMGKALGIKHRIPGSNPRLKGHKGKGKGKGKGSQGHTIQREIEIQEK
jgi:hypothetical protein